MTRRLPPLNPLHTFEVVARNLNLTAASRELHVTQSAVSRQVAVLEAYLGVELFRREPHGVVLTRIGQDLADGVVPAFGAIAAAAERVTRRASPGDLRVRTYTTFAAKWLIPRLPEFKRLHPQVGVRIKNGVPDVDFDRDDVDVAIQFGDGRWSGTKTDLLFQDEIEPVCSPAFANECLAGSKKAGPESLLGQRLLVSQHRRSDWDDWLAAAGLSTHAEGAERMTFNSSVLTWQAAMDGLGVAIGQAALLGPELASKRLVRPFDRPLRRDRGHFLVRPAVQRESRKVRDFRDWLLEAVAREHAGSGAVPGSR